MEERTVEPSPTSTAFSVPQRHMMAPSTTRGRRLPMLRTGGKPSPMRRCLEMRVTFLTESKNCAVQRWQRPRLCHPRRARTLAPSGAPSDSLACFVCPCRAVRARLRPVF